jgi:hypothetical protein
MRGTVRHARWTTLLIVVGCSALSDFDYEFRARDAGPGMDGGGGNPADGAQVGDAAGDAAIDCTLQSCCELLEIRERTCEGGRDEDCDTLVDCADPDCRQAAVCCPAPTFESGDQACADGLDNDCDGLLDCGESSCRAVYGCTCMTRVPENDTPATCVDDADNDCDRQVDCDDVDCRSSPNCCQPTAGQASRETSCTDGKNNDCDADGADCADPDCRLTTGTGGTAAETGAACLNAVDDDCDGFVDCKDEDCRGTLECCVQTPGQELRETSCNDGLNNDCDAVGIDCFDSDCAQDPACCTAPVGGESNEKLCLNEKDDDCDGLFDCADPQCAEVTECCTLHLRNNGQRLTTEETGFCFDQFDNDCDGFINCADSDCGALGLRGCLLNLEARSFDGPRGNAISPL